MIDTLNIVDDIIASLEEYHITEKLEIAYFLAQAAHESADFTKFEEGTKYRYSRAKAIWPNRSAAIEGMQNSLDKKDNDFVEQPWLFNFVYGNRMGNIYPEDGYNFRGAGIFQLTGRANYQLFNNWLHDEIHNINTIRDYCVIKEGAILSAIWFWQYNKIGAKALRNDLVAVTKTINGGIIGLTDRQTKLDKYKQLLGVS